MTKYIHFSLYIHTKRKWAQFDMRGNFINRFDAVDVNDEWEILCMYMYIL